MRYVLGPTFSLVVPAPLAVPSPTGKADPQVAHKGVEGSVATFTVPAYDPATSNTLMEVRLYLAPEGSELPVGSTDYIASPLPFGHADTSGLQAGGDVPINLPTVDPAAYHAQYVLGYDA